MSVGILLLGMVFLKEVLRDLFPFPALWSRLYAKAKDSDLKY